MFLNKSIISKLNQFKIENNNINLNRIENQLLQLLQDGINFKHSPYTEISNQLGITEKEILELLKNAINKKKIRRFSASLNHRLLGYTFNCMLVLDIPKERLCSVSNFICQFSEISHCYERKRILNNKINWPYNLFAMIHGHTKKECEFIVNKIINYCSISEYLLIYSTKELKKTGVRL